MIKKAQATIYVTDIDNALRFYSELLEMHVKSHWGKDFAVNPRYDRGQEIRNCESTKIRQSQSK